MTFQLPDRSVMTTLLTQLEMVVLDTETTGLDVARDRIIELAGVRVRQCAVLEAESFSSLINPGVPISAASTAVHHITSADVADAPPFAEVVHAFAEWAGAEVIGGYMIGFDLAIMRAEHHRHALHWQMPLALDVQALAQLVAPRLPEFSLEAIAAWLAVPITRRHRALADAEAAAHIFVRLVPMLAERGIRTLAEALRACEELQTRQRSAGAGLPPSWKLEPPPRWRSGRRLDSYPFRHRVREVMSRELAQADSSITLDAALQRMLARRVSSLFIAPEEERGAWGILTERDILRAIAANGASVLRHPAGQYASFPLLTVPENEFIYRAMARMAEHGIRHLGVRDGDDALIGAISQSDLLRYRASEAVVLDERLREATSAAELAELWPMLIDAVRALVADNAPANTIAAVIARELRALTRRACELAEAAMREAGKGGPPAPFCLLVLGSAGRGESLLAMDQDNAILHLAEDESADAWFAAFGRRVNDILNEAGVPYCPGEVMAGNERWRASRRRWLKRVEKWLGNATPEDLLHVDIFFDFRRACGERRLARDFRRRCLAMVKGARTLLKFLALQASDFESPLGWFGRIRTEEGRVDLKKSALMPIYSAARVLALKMGSPARSTPTRLRAAARAGICPKPAAQNLLQAHRIVLGLVLQQQLRDIERGLKPSNKVALNELDAYQRDEVRWALEQVREVPALLGVPELRTS